MSALLIHEYLERLAGLLRHNARRLGLNYALQPVHLEVMHYLAICNRYSDTPRAVSEYLGLTKGTVSQSLKVLEHKGLITRIADERDKRVVHLGLSTMGKRFFADYVPAPVLNAACSHLPKQTQALIAESMKNLLLACQRANEMKSFGPCHTCMHNRRIKGEYFCGLTQEALSRDDIKLICREHTYA